MGNVFWKRWSLAQQRQNCTQHGGPTGTTLDVVHGDVFSPAGSVKQNSGGMNAQDDLDQDDGMIFSVAQHHAQAAAGCLLGFCLWEPWLFNVRGATWIKRGESIADASHR